MTETPSQRRQREHREKLEARPTFTRTGSGPVRLLSTNKIHRRDCLRLRLTPDDNIDDDLEAADDICHTCYASPQAELQRERRHTQRIVDETLRREARERDRRDQRIRLRRRKISGDPTRVAANGYASGVQVGWSPEGIKVALKLADDHDSTWLDAAIEAWESGEAT